MSEPKSFHNISKETRTTKLDAIPFADKWYAIRITTEIEVEHAFGNLVLPEKASSPTVSYTIIEADQLEKLVDGKFDLTTRPSSFYRHPKYGTLRYVPKRLHKYLTQHGSFDFLGCDEVKEHVGGEDAIFKHLEAGGSLEDLIWSDFDAMQYRDIHGNYMVAPIVFEYISAQSDDSLYDLTALVEHLRDRDDIQFVDINWKGMTRLEKDDKLVQKAVHRIPSYNIDEDDHGNEVRSYFAQFTWVPTLDQYTEIMDAHVSNMDRHKYIFDNDMLGLKAAGITRRDTFYRK